MSPMVEIYTHFSVLGFMSGALAFAAAAQEAPLDLLPLVDKEACIPGSHRSVAIVKTVLDRLPPPGHCTDSRLRHMP